MTNLLKKLNRTEYKACRLYEHKKLIYVIFQQLSSRKCNFLLFSKQCLDLHVMATTNYNQIQCIESNKKQLTNTHRQSIFVILRRGLKVPRRTN